MSQNIMHQFSPETIETVKRQRFSLRINKHSTRYACNGGGCIWHSLVKAEQKAQGKTFRFAQMPNSDQVMKALGLLGFTDTAFTFQSGANQDFIKAIIERNDSGCFASEEALEQFFRLSWH